MRQPFAQLGSVILTQLLRVAEGNDSFGTTPVMNRWVKFDIRIESVIDFL